MDQEPIPTGPKGPQRTNSYLKYGNFALQLLGGIGLAGWVGYRIDKYLAFRFPLFTLSFVLLVFGGMMYQMYKKINEE